MNTSTFAKNIKELQKGLEVSDAEVEEICGVVREGADNFNNITNLSLQKGMQMNEMFYNKLQRLNEHANYLESFRPAIRSSIADAMNYLTCEGKRLY